MKAVDVAKAVGRFFTQDVSFAAKTKPDSTPQVGANPTNANVVTAGVVPKDEMGRSLLPIREPLLGPIFLPRVMDRRSQVRPPWSAEQIIDALEAAENGDMGPQSDLFDMMEDRDAALLGFYQSRKLAPAAKSWTIEPANDSPLAKEIADFVRDEINAIPNFPLAYRDAFDAIGRSVSALWIDWQEGGRSHNGQAPKSKFRIDGLHHINPKRYRFHWLEEKFLILPDWAFGKAQELGLMNDFNPTKFTEIQGMGIGVAPPPWKVIIHRTRIKSGHPAKASALRVCAMLFYFRLKALGDISVYCEIYGMPLRVGKYPPGASEEEKMQLRVGLEMLGSDASAIISNMVNIEFVESKSRTGGGMPYLDFIKECERQMQLALLGQDQTNTHNPTGGRTQVKEGGAPIRQDLVEADCIDAQTTFTMQLCRPIVGFSSYEKPTVDPVTGQTRWAVADALTPKFKIEFEQEADYESMAAVDEIVYTKLKLPVTNGMLAKRYKRDLPKDTDPEAIIDYSAPAPQIGFGADGNQPTAGTVPPITKPPTKKPAPTKPARPVTEHIATNFAAETTGAADYKYPSTRVNITGDVATSVLSLGDIIPDDALADDGREDTPHVTIKYGIDPTVTIDELRKVIGPKAAGSLTLGLTAFFAAPDYDVVFITVNSPDIVELNKAITAGVKTVATQANYVPHLTLARVQSGRGHEFAGNGSVNGVVFDYRSVYYSDVDGNLTRIQAIRGHVRVTPKRLAADYPDGWPEGEEHGTGLFAAEFAMCRTLGLMAMGRVDDDQRAQIESDQEQIRLYVWDEHRKMDAQMAAQPATLARRAQPTIDSLVERATTAAEAAFGSLSDDVRAVIKSASSLEEIPALLRKSFSALDASDLERRVRRVMFVARLQGRATSKRTPPAS